MFISRKEEQELRLGDFYIRLGDMVRDVVCPRERWLADVNAAKDFLTSLIEWENKVAAYEVASGDKISEAVRVATIMDQALDAVKSTLQQRNGSVLRDVLDC